MGMPQKTVETVQLQAEINPELVRFANYLLSHPSIDLEVPQEEVERMIIEFEDQD